jgi:hypothetical protein
VHILHGHAHQAYYWPVGTSYVIAAGYWVFGIHPWVARLVMIALSVGSVVTTTLIARRLLRDTRAALLAGWTLALFPEMIMQAAQPDSFDLTLLGVNLTVLFALRAWQRGRVLDYAAAGVGLGIAALARPSTLSLLLAMGIFAAILLRRRHQEGQPTGLGRVAVGSAVLLACTAAVITPALAHNSADHAGLTLSTNNEQNLWLGNNRYTPNYKTYYLGQHPLSDFSPEVRNYMRPFVYGTHPTRAQRSADFDEAKGFIEDHPAVSLLRTTNRVRSFWTFDYSLANEFRTDWGKGAKVEAVGLLPEVGGYMLLGLLVIIALVFARDLFRPGALWFLIATIAAFALPYAIVYGAGRWNYPELGLLAVLAGAGAVWLIDTPDRWRRLVSSRVFWIALVVFMLVQAEYSYFAVTSG